VSETAPVAGTFKDHSCHHVCAQNLGLQARPDFIALSDHVPPHLHLCALRAEVQVEAEGLTITPIEVNHLVPTVGTPEMFRREFAKMPPGIKVIAVHIQVRYREQLIQELNSFEQSDAVFFTIERASERSGRHPSRLCNRSMLGTAAHF
jgi:hypothetical protein